MAFLGAVVGVMVRAGDCGREGDREEGEREKETKGRVGGNEGGRGEMGGHHRRRWVITAGDGRLTLRVIARGSILSSSSVQTTSCWPRGPKHPVSTS